MSKLGRLLMLVMGGAALMLALNAQGQNAPNPQQQGCWPATQQDLKQCKQDCVKTSPTYDQCLSKCETWYRNCQKQPGETKEIPRF